MSGATILDRAHLDLETGPTLTTHTAEITANLRRIGALTGTPVMAVVKADAFGAGVAHTARALVEAGATWFGVTGLDEAFGLRDAGIETACLSWLNTTGADFGTAIRRRVDVAVPGREHLLAVVRAAAAVGSPARIHLHADTGMARDGAAPGEWDELCRSAAAAQLAGLVEVVGIMGHLPCADRPEDPSNATGRRRFEDALAVARAHGLRPALRHLAATAAALLDPAARYDLVRIGAGLVGLADSGSAGLRPALRLTAPVLLTRAAARGTRVGYGHDHVVAADTTLALLPIGYADGVPRRLSREATVLLAGRRCPIVGRVSMDQIVVDAGDRDVPLGTVATVFGPGDDGEPTVHDVAEWAGTLPHEIVTGIGPRVRRVAA